jgi:hypothetical protein
MPADKTDALFSDFFRDLAIAWRSLSSYPRGHPAAIGGLAKACSTLARLLAETGPIELTATRDALFWSDRRFQSTNAVQLARLLRRRRAAGVAFDPAATPEELEVFLRALALDVRSAREAGSLAAELAAGGLARVRVSDLDFSAVALIEGDEDVPSPEVGALAQRVIRRMLASGGLPPDQLALWITSGKTAADLLQMLLASGGTDPAAGAWGPAAFASALRAAAEDYCENPDAERAAGIAGFHFRLRREDRDRFVQELAAAVARKALARGSLAELEAALPAQVASDLGAAVATAVARAQGDLAAAEAAAPKITPQQLAGLRRAFATDDVDSLADAETAIEALESLLELPEERPGLVLSPAAAEIGRDLADPALERASTVILLELADTSEVPPEVLPQILYRLEAGYRKLLAGGRLRQALALVERVHRAAVGDEPAPTAFRRSAERLSGRESLQALVESLPEISEEALAVVPSLLERLGPTAVRHLLGVLAETDNRRLRHLLLDLLANLGRLGPVVVRDATALLTDSRWYVVRNMLLLLRRVGDPGSVPAVRKCADHPDLRVRLEAIRNLFAFDKDVPRELLRRALTHRDPRQAEAAMELAGEHGIAEAVEPIVEYLRGRDLFGARRAVRLKAIRALAAIGDPGALVGLARFRARFQLLPPALEERRELYRTLASYPEEARQVWIQSGLRSRDAEIRRASETLARRPETAP